MLKKKLMGKIGNILMAVALVASYAWLDFNSALFWGETELPLDLREKK